MTATRTFPGLMTLALAAAAAAQAPCPVSSIGASAYGQGCSPVFTTPSLLAQLDVVNCEIALTVQATGGCCNTFLTNYVLRLGLGQTQVPLPPPAAPGCDLLVSPDVFLFQPANASTSDTFALPIPPSLPLPLTLFAQGGALYFTTIGLSTDVGLTSGVQMNLN